MSDYGDDYSDNDDEWYYIDEEYIAADDLAEHAVASPPPATGIDEDTIPDWDRFDYFNDLEYASNGYDDATFAVHNTPDAKIGQKRKRKARKEQSRKRRAAETAPSTVDTSQLEHPPIVWRSHADREIRPELLEDNAKPYALFKDWREQLAETPQWARGSPPASPTGRLSRPGKGRPLHSHVSRPVSPPSDIDLIDTEKVDDDFEEDGGPNISQEAIVAALQRQLAAAGGPLSDMDPQQLLEFAMRMALGKDDGDDIAGEMAEAMLEGEGEEDDADAEENLLSWVSQQRNAKKQGDEETPNSSDAAKNSKRPPTPPLSEANPGVRTSQATSRTVKTSLKSSLKRKADEDADLEAGGSTQKVKKRVTRSFDAPTAASRAKSAPAKKTKPAREKNS